MTVREAVPTHPDGTSVRAIMAATGLSDRAVRDELDRLLEEEGVPICTRPTTDGKSVYIATAPEHVDAALAHISSKAGALLRRKRRLRMSRESLAWRPSLF